MINNLQQSKFVKKIDFCHHLMSKKKVFYFLGTILVLLNVRATFVFY
jgi:hypothetical protein